MLGAVVSATEKFRDEGDLMVGKIASTVDDLSLLRVDAEFAGDAARSIQSRKPDTCIFRVKTQSAASCQNAEHFFISRRILSLIQWYIPNYGIFIYTLILDLKSLGNI